MASFDVSLAAAEAFREGEIVMMGFYLFAFVSQIIPDLRVGGQCVWSGIYQLDYRH